MPRNIYLQLTKLHDVSGRIDYATNPDRQEHLYGVYNTTTIDFWKSVAKECNEEFLRSNKKGKCIEAREIFFSLPEYFLQFRLQKILEALTNAFCEHYHVECISAMHHNKTEKNLHIHLIFAERRLLPEPVDTIAKRAMHYNDDGRFVKTKKEILDDDGNIRPGCTIIPKGAIVRRNYFSVKDPIFQSPSFLPEIKKMYATIINTYIDDPSQHLHVFSKKGPYLATIKIGRRNRKKSQIETINNVVQSWNNTVDYALEKQITYHNLCMFKQDMITHSIEQSKEEHGKNPDLYVKIVSIATDFLQNIIHIISTYPRLNQLKSTLQEKLDTIEQIKKELLPALEQQYIKINGLFKNKEKKKVKDKITEAEKEIQQKKEELSEMLTANGYTTMSDFLDDYENCKATYDQYTKDPEDTTLISQHKKPSLTERINAAENEKGTNQEPQNKIKQLER